MVKGKTLSRARATPRQIRDIRPARQLPRNDAFQEDESDDWWFRSGGNGRGDGSCGSSNVDSSSAAALHIQRVAAVNGARVRFGRNSMLGSDEVDSSNSDELHGHDRFHGEGIRGYFGHIFKWFLFDIMWDGFMALPTQKKLKRIIACMILFSTWKTIYFADLDNYSKPKWESSFFTNYKGSSSSSGVTVKSMGKELSSLALSEKNPFDSDSGDLSLGKKLVEEEMRLDRGAPNTDSLYDAGNLSTDEKKNMPGQSMSQDLQGLNTRIMSNMLDSNSGGLGSAGSRNDDWFGDGGMTPSKGGTSQLQVPMPAGHQMQHYNQPQYQSFQLQPNLKPSNIIQSGISQSNFLSNPRFKQSDNFHPQQPSFQQQLHLQSSNSMQLGTQQSKLAPQPQQQINFQPQFSSGVQQSNPHIADGMKSGMSQPKMISWPDTQSQQQNQRIQYSLFQQQQGAMSNGNGIQPGMNDSKMMSWSDPQQNRQLQQPPAQTESFSQSKSLGQMQSKRMPLLDSLPQQQNKLNSYSLTQHNGDSAHGQYQMNSNS